MARPEQYDAALLGILQNEGEISKFLVAICGFLYRRTDFYVHLTPDGRMGFPPGVAKKILLAAYKKFEDLANAERTRKEKAKVQSEPVHEVVGDVPPPCVRIEEVVTSTSDSTENFSDTTNASAMATAAATETTTATAGAATVTAEVSRGSELSIPIHQRLPEPSHNPTEATTCDTTPNSLAGGTSDASLNTTTSTPGDGSVNLSATAFGEHLINNSSPVSEPVASEPGGKKVKTGGDASDDDDDEVSKQQKIFQANSESYNGAVRENYAWSQSITDVDVRLKVPKHVKKGKDLTVVISKKHLRVTYMDLTGQTVTLVDDDLTWEVDKEESIWSLVSGEHVHVNLEKKEERWWDALVVSEPKINIRKIDASRPMSDLGEEEQAKIDELMYNEQQKRLGKPQSHEQKVHEMLKKAWDVEGSPFKGQPFDPSVINVSPGGGGI